MSTPHALDGAVDLKRTASALKGESPMCQFRGRVPWALHAVLIYAYASNACLPGETSPPR